MRNWSEKEKYDKHCIYAKVRSYVYAYAYMHYDEFIHDNDRQ